MIVDACLFGWELDLLELRLLELDSVVDRFVVVEADQTFRGNPKPLLFSEHRERFRRWHERIWYVPVFDMPDTPDPWQREAHQRNAIVRGLHGMPDDAIVLVGDVDELPNVEAVECVGQENDFDSRWCPTTSLLQTPSIYYANNRGEFGWHGTQATSAWWVRHLGAEGVRGYRHRPGIIYYGGGWHLSSLIGDGGAEALRYKLQNFSHAECDCPEWTDLDHLWRCIAQGIDPCGRTDVLYRLSPVDDTYPRTLLADPARWAHFFYPNTAPMEVKACAAS